MTKYVLFLRKKDVYKRQVTLWQINRIYKEQGYISSLVKEIKYFYIEQPEGYSVGKTVELAQEIEDGENIVSETDKGESEESVDNTAADTSETVSYTHLDVYKRQIHMCATVEESNQKYCPG